MLLDLGSSLKTFRGIWDWQLKRSGQCLYRLTILRFLPEFCAVLAETDVINLVSKGLSTANIVKGINLSIAGRVVKLLGSLKAESPIALVGGMGMK